MKHPMKSKTVWFNILMVLAVTATELMPIVEFLPEEAQPHMSVVLMTLIALGNVLIRFKTEEGLTWRSSGD